MYLLRNKTVFLISPERWGKMRISKHHYALELADRGCTVYFIEPPTLETSGVMIKPTADHPGVHIVTYKPVFRGERFLPAWIFEWLLRRQIHLLVKNIGRKPDVVWCFQSFLFRDLRWFGAPVRIFFLADQFNKPGVPPEADTATLTLAVSDTIYDRIKSGGRPVCRVNHGLQRAFHEDLINRLQEPAAVSSHPPKVIGYLGNLRMEALNRPAMLRIVDGSPDLTFIFWGSYKPAELNLGGLQSDEANQFIDQLIARPNVQLRGAFHGRELRNQMEEADAFWLCLKLDLTEVCDGSNSHKIMEYLSTGKPVITQPVSSYRDTDLLYMMPDAREDFAAFFQTVISRLKSGEDPSLARKRMEYALENSYEAQLVRIEEMLPSNPVND
jgi:glycosyltransferase involved in cell wall biosynthesis